MKKLMKILLGLMLMLTAHSGYSRTPGFTQEELNYVAGLGVAVFVDSTRCRIVQEQTIDGSVGKLADRLVPMVQGLLDGTDTSQIPEAQKMNDFKARTLNGLDLIRQADYWMALGEFRRQIDDINKYIYSIVGDFQYADVSAPTRDMIDACNLLINIADLMGFYCDWYMCRHYNQLALERNDLLSALLAFQYLMRIYGDIYYFGDGKNLTEDILFSTIDTADDEVHEIYLRLLSFYNWDILSHRWVSDFENVTIEGRRRGEILRFVRDSWHKITAVAPYPDTLVGDYGYMMISVFCGEEYASLGNHNTAYEMLIGLKDYIDRNMPHWYKTHKFSIYERSLWDAIALCIKMDDYESVKRLIEEILDYLEACGQRYISPEDLPHCDDPLIWLYYALFNEQYMYFFQYYYATNLRLDSTTLTRDYRMTPLTNPGDIDLYPIFSTDFASCKSYRDMDINMMKDYILSNALGFLNYMAELIPEVEKRYPNIKQTAEGFYLEWFQSCTYFDMLCGLYFHYKGLKADIAYDSADHINALGVLQYQNDYFSNVLGNSVTPSYYYYGLLNYAEGNYEEAENFLFDGFRYTDELNFRINCVIMMLKCIEHTGNEELAINIGKNFPAEIREALYGFRYFQKYPFADYIWTWSEEAARLINDRFLSSSRPDEFATDVYNNILMLKGYETQFRNSLDLFVAQSESPELKMRYARYRQIEDSLSAKGQLRYTTELVEAKSRVLAEIESAGNMNLLVNSDWMSVRSALADGECALELYKPQNEPQKVYALIIKSEYAYPHVVELNVADTDCKSYDGLMELYEMIWQPLEQELQGVNAIYFSLDRFIDALPVEYAVSSDGQSVSTRYKCMRLSSTKILAEDYGSNQAERTAVLYGGLDFDVAAVPAAAQATVRDGTRGSNDPLWRSLDEVNMLHELLEQEGYGCTRYIGDAGTEATFNALSGKKLAILHLATHGLQFDNETVVREYADIEDVQLFDRLRKSQDDDSDHTDLWRSAVALSGCNMTLTHSSRAESSHDADYVAANASEGYISMDDGILTAAEVSSLDLSGIDLVVLSSCHSGYYGGADGYGLQRGFKMGGAHSLILTLWEVDDEATLLFMTEFYRVYLCGGSKQEALARAQKYLRDDSEYSDPYYWAAFILVDGL